MNIRLRNIVLPSIKPSDASLLIYIIPNLFSIALNWCELNLRGILVAKLTYTIIYFQLTHFLDPWSICLWFLWLAFLSIFLPYLCNILLRKILFHPLKRDKLNFLMWRAKNHLLIDLLYLFFFLVFVFDFLTENFTKKTNFGVKLVVVLIFFIDCGISTITTIRYLGFAE